MQRDPLREGQISVCGTDTGERSVARPADRKLAMILRSGLEDAVALTRMPKAGPFRVRLCELLRALLSSYPY